MKISPADEGRWTEPFAPKSIITLGRVCNMLGEISKRKNDCEGAIKYYLRGLKHEPLGFNDNYLDLADISEIMNENEIHCIIMNFAKLVTQINEGNLLAEEDSDAVEVLTPQEWSDLETAIKTFNQRLAAIQVEPHFLKIINVLQEILDVYISDLDIALKGTQTQTDTVVEGAGEEQEEEE